MLVLARPLLLFEELHLLKGVSPSDILLEILPCPHCLLIVLRLLHLVSFVRGDLELNGLLHPGFIFFLADFAWTFVQFADKVVEFGHGLVLALLRVFH